MRELWKGWTALLVAAVIVCGVLGVARHTFWPIEFRAKGFLIVFVGEVMKQAHGKIDTPLDRLKSGVIYEPLHNAGFYIWQNQLRHQACRIHWNKGGCGNLVSASGPPVGLIWQILELHSDNDAGAKSLIFKRYTQSRAWGERITAPRYLGAVALKIPSLFGEIRAEGGPTVLSGYSSGIPSTPNQPNADYTYRNTEGGSEAHNLRPLRHGLLGVQVLAIIVGLAFGAWAQITCWRRSDPGSPQGWGWFALGCIGMAFGCVPFLWWLG